MMLCRLLPKTVVGQLMAMLVVVLLLAQMLNLGLLVGEQRIQARSKTFNEAIEYSANLIQTLPQDLPSEFPYDLREGPTSPNGGFFLSLENRAESLASDVEALPRFNARFQSLLAERGITALRTSVTFSPDGVEGDQPPPPRPMGAPPSEAAGMEGFYPGGPRGPMGTWPSGGSGEMGRAYQRGPRGPMGIYPGEPMGPMGTPPYNESGEVNGFFQSGSPSAQLPLEGKLQEIRVSAEVAPGVWFNALMPHTQTESLTGRIILATSLLLGLTLLGAWGFARRISRPLDNFTRAAERLGRGDSSEDLEESGPTDIRQAAKAFNRMQMRLSRTLETQRVMLRAVGHDLRTPLTSLRLRAETIPDDLGKTKFIATLEDMTVMTEEILNWAKDASGTEDLALVCLESMLSSIVDDYQDQGRDVVLQDFDSMTLNIRRTAIKRAVSNLINNALIYGVKAKLTVERDGDRVLIHIDDEGPGVAEERLLDVIKPFVRLEASRSKATGGTGLGLSISQSIAQIHGGHLILKNLKPCGLRATLRLPH